MSFEIKADFKDYTDKGTGVALVRLEVLTSHKEWWSFARLSGKVLLLTVDTEQQELPLDNGELDPEGMDELPMDDGEPAAPSVTVNNYYVSAETGEVTDYDADVAAEIADFTDAPALPEGGDAE